MNVSTHKSVGNFGKNLVQHLAYVKNIWLLKNTPNLKNMPNHKYLCQPPPKYAKFHKFGIKICQLATLFPTPALNETHPNSAEQYDKLIDGRGGSRGGDRPPLKPKKVTLITMISYNSASNISKPVLSNSFVVFELSHHVGLLQSSIVVSQQCCEVCFVSTVAAKPLIRYETQISVSYKAYTYIGSVSVT